MCQALREKKHGPHCGPLESLSELGKSYSLEVTGRKLALNRTGSGGDFLVLYRMNEKLHVNESKFQKALESFREYTKSETFGKDMEDREFRKSFFLKKMRQEINELSVAEIIKKLWASQIWANKDYLVRKILQENGIDTLSEAFSRLAKHQGTVGERYDWLLEHIKGMGPSMITELLSYADPLHTGIWNDKTRKALAWLEVKNIAYDYKISGQEYEQINSTLQSIADRLREEYKNADLLFVDYFLWETWDQFARYEKSTKEVTLGSQVKPASRHNEIRDKLTQIGSWLGFETEAEKLVAPGARLDVVWKARIANLGIVSYVFEVQDRGSVDSLILNLQKAQLDHTVQKLVVVSDTEQIPKIQKEVATLPESFRNMVTFWEFGDVDDTYQSLEQVTTSIAKLSLMNE